MVHCLEALFVRMENNHYFLLIVLNPLPQYFELFILTPSIRFFPRTSDRERSPEKGGVCERGSERIVRFLESHFENLLGN
jgi:hypothetical protein